MHLLFCLRCLSYSDFYPANNNHVTWKYRTAWLGHPARSCSTGHACGESSQKGVARRCILCKALFKHHTNGNSLYVNVASGISVHIIGTHNTYIYMYKYGMSVYLICWLYIYIYTIIHKINICIQLHMYTHTCTSLWPQRITTAFRTFRCRVSDVLWAIQRPRITNRGMTWWYLHITGWSHIIHCILLLFAVRDIQSSILKQGTWEEASIEITWHLLGLLSLSDSVESLWSWAWAFSNFPHATSGWQTTPDQHGSCWPTSAKREENHLERASHQPQMRGQRR